MQKLIITNELNEKLSKEIDLLKPDKIFILTDTSTHRDCLPIIKDNISLKEASSITVPQGDNNKNIDTLAYIWRNLSDLSASRKSLLINLGGGMISDMGAFAAATFKRGIQCINIPTTLLAMVDASLGGKTGINFNGLKNEVGAFFEADAVLIDMQFLTTLDKQNNLSGYAEMIKHGLISTNLDYDSLINFKFNEKSDYKLLAKLVEESIEVKKECVNKDPFDKGVRKTLNLGHTVGHAFESFALSNEKPIYHGYAVAWGLISELYIAHRQCGFPQEELMPIIEMVKERYGSFHITCENYDQLYDLILHDKKNTKGAGIVTMPLLKKRGDIALDEIVDKELIYQSFDFFRDFMEETA